MPFQQRGRIKKKKKDSHIHTGGEGESLREKRLPDAWKTAQRRKGREAERAQLLFSATFSKPQRGTAPGHCCRCSPGGRFEMRVQGGGLCEAWARPGGGGVSLLPERPGAARSWGLGPGSPGWGVPRGPRVRAEREQGGGRRSALPGPGLGPRGTYRPAPLPPQERRPGPISRPALPRRPVCLEGEGVSAPS